VLALGLLSAFLLRRHSASSRHWVLAAAVVCAAAVPALGLVVPTWQVGIATASIHDTVAPQAEPASERPGPAASATTATPVVGTRPSSLDVGSVLMWTWLAGVAVCAVLLATGLARLAWLASRARRLTAGRWVELAAELARDAGLRRRVRLLHGSQRALLVTWGFMRPTILLPVTALDWSDERIRIVLRHEMAHIRRHDWIVQLVGETVHAIHWFNPIVWIACRRMRDESEHACDDEVIASGVDAAAYATHLLDLARLFTTGRRPWAATPAMAQPCSLERRITTMLSTRVNRSPVTRSFQLATATAAVLITTAIAGGVLAQSPTAIFSGTVTDPSGAPLPDTTITLTHGDTTTGRAVPTDQAGYFEFTGLPPGEYALEARATGFKTVEDKIELRAGDSVRRDMRLNIGVVQESITVGASPGPSMRSADPSKIRSLVDKMRGQRLQPPLKVKDVRPEYSQTLRDAGIEGTVVLEGHIATDGSVTGIRVVSAEHQELVAAARDAASQWKFEPTRLWGTPVETVMTMTFNFKRESQR